mmetsp:Transcript_739/g.1238  ORF Transcript_739/g.1238 Transcript_739/m.1238 type:complete len:107 (+) Transcript_739:211-531(+)
MIIPNTMKNRIENQSTGGIGSQAVAFMLGISPNVASNILCMDIKNPQLTITPRTLNIQIEAASGNRFSRTGGKLYTVPSRTDPNKVNTSSLDTKLLRGIPVHFESA